MREGTAPGPDAIHVEMLHHLGPNARKYLLNIANHSLRTGHVAVAWVRSEIIALLKATKDAGLPASYRPVSLTSVVCKTIERMIANRLLHILDEKLHDAQSGFRPGRSTADQCHKLADRITRVFTTRHKDAWGNDFFGRLAALFIDFEKAFDKVDHFKLVEKLRAMGCPPHLLRWIRNFLSHRKCHARINRTCSASRLFTCGVPQGSVLGPILFDIFLDDLVVSLAANGVDCGFFADDLTLYVDCSDPASAKISLQKALDLLSSWCHSNHFNINSAKTKYQIFARALYKPIDLDLSFRGEKILKMDSDEKEELKLLGLRLSQKFRFWTHVTYIKTVLRSRLLQLSAISGSSWGPSGHDLRVFFCGHVRSVMLYLCDVWYPYTATTSRNDLNVLLSRGAKTISGCTAPTDPDSALREADLLPFEFYAKLEGVKRFEQYRRLPANHFRKDLAVHPLYADVISAVCTANGLPLDHPREPLRASRPLYAPWDTGGASAVDIQPSAFLPIPKDNCVPDAVLEVLKFISNALALAIAPPAEYELWTDGSVKPASDTDEGPKPALSGAAALLFTPLRQVFSTQRQCGPLACSYRTECIGLDDGLDLCIQHGLSNCTLRCGLDSQSLLSALSTGPIGQNGLVEHRIWDKLLKLAARGVQITLLFVFAHCGTECNELVDLAADAATRGSPDPTGTAPVWITDFLAATKRYLYSTYTPPPSHRERLLGKQATPLFEHRKLPRRIETIMSQIRTNECKLLGRFAARLRITKLQCCRFCCEAEHAAAEEPVQPQSAKPRALEPHKCPRCASVLSNRANLLAHVRTQHPTAYSNEAELYALCGIKPRGTVTPALPPVLQCPACPLVAKLAHSLKKHINSEAKSGCQLHAPYRSDFVRPPAICIPTGQGPDETPEHVLFECPALASLRLDLGVSVPPDERGKFLLSSKGVELVIAVLRILHPDLVSALQLQPPPVSSQATLALSTAPGHRTVGDEVLAKVGPIAEVWIPGDSAAPTHKAAGDSIAVAPETIDTTPSHALEDDVSGPQDTTVRYATKNRISMRTRGT